MSLYNSDGERRVRNSICMVGGYSSKKLYSRARDEVKVSIYGVQDVDEAVIVIVRESASGVDGLSGD